MELPDGTLVEYDLDARGRRVGRSVDGVLQRAWIYDGQLDPVAELDGEGDVVSRFVYGSLPHVPDLIERAGAPASCIVDTRERTVWSMGNVLWRNPAWALS